MSRTSISIASVIAFITSAFQFLPQLMQIFQQLGPILDLLKQLFANNAPSMSIAGTAVALLGYQGYAAYRDSRGSAAGRALARNNAAFGQVITELATMGGPEAQSAIRNITEAITQNAQAAREAMTREAAERKSDPEALKKQLDSLTSAVGILAQNVQTIRDSTDRTIQLDPPPQPQPVE